jgi:hypothetical protein
MVTFVTALTAGRMGEFIYAADKTFISWIVLVLFFSASCHLGCQIRGRQRYDYKISHEDFRVTDRAMETCTQLGFLGTVIGLALLITDTFANIDIANHATIKNAMTALASGVGVALTTTLVGLVCAIALNVQLAVVRERWRT